MSRRCRDEPSCSGSEGSFKGARQARPAAAARAGAPVPAGCKRRWPDIGKHRPARLSWPSPASACCCWQGAAWGRLAAGRAGLCSRTRRPGPVRLAGRARNRCRPRNGCPDRRQHATACRKHATALVSSTGTLIQFPPTRGSPVFQEKQRQNARPRAKNCAGVRF